MKRLKCYTIIGIIFVILTGTLFHFLYNWTNKNFIVGLFTPINESVWEHMKLLFFPMLLYSFIMILNLKADYPCITSSLCFGILIGTLLIPIFFYAYTFILGKNTLFFDILIFMLSSIIAFFTAYKFTLSCKLQPYTFLFCFLVGVLFICFVVFTLYPPHLKIFADPTDSTVSTTSTF